MGMVSHIGREVTVSVMGQSWTFSRWTRKVWIALTDYAKGRVPNPLVEAHAVLPGYIIADAEAIRQLVIADEAEKVKAAEEGRLPVLMASKFSPSSDMLIQKSIDKRNLYMGFGSPELGAFMQSVDGMSFIFYLLLKPNHPDVTEDDAYEIMMAMDAADKARVMSVTRGDAQATPKNESAPVA